MLQCCTKERSSRAILYIVLEHPLLGGCDQAGSFKGTAGHVLLNYPSGALTSLVPAQTGVRVLWSTIGRIQ